MFGIIGAAIILLAFLLNQVGKWSSETLSYDIANAIGAGFLIYYAYTLESWPFVALNTVWFLMSAIDVVRALR